MKVLNCPYCNKAIIYVSIGDYASGYESYGYKVNCSCGFAWENTEWNSSREETVKLWNDIVLKEDTK